MNKALIPILLAAAGLVATATPAQAHERPQREVTHGHFHTLSGGADLGFDIQGKAKMVRSDRDGGTTEVVVRVKGLAPNATYPTHVHNQPCSWTPPGGGHYQNVVGPVVDAVNEMWPVITTDDKGKGTGEAFHSFWARPEAQSIVIHYPANTSIRLACLDLS